VRVALDVDCDLVRSLALKLGDLRIFDGRYSLQRVTPLRWPTPRYVSIFSYFKQPDMAGARANKAALWPGVTNSSGACRASL
jgi:hypothetical protein